MLKDIRLVGDMVQVSFHDGTCTEYSVDDAVDLYFWLHQHYPIILEILRRLIKSREEM